MLQEFSELRGVHRIVFELVVMIMLGKILTRRDSKSLKKTKTIKLPYLQKKGRKRKKGEKRERA